MSARHPADPNDPYPELGRGLPGQPWNDPTELEDEMFKPDENALADGAQLGNPKPGEDVRLRGIPLDEPIFVLRAADPLAAAMVKHWCDVHALNPRCNSGMLTAARKISLLMDRWPDRKWPGE